jgi:hypothetical protein
MGLEVVVRPVVFPNIRPTTPRVLLPSADSPEQGLCVLSGGGGKFVDTSYSFSANISKSAPKKEKKRQVDKLRIFHIDPQTGDVIEDQYIDVEQTKKIRLDGDKGKEPDKIIYGNYATPDNVKVLEKDITKTPEPGED